MPDKLHFYVLLDFCYVEILNRKTLMKCANARCLVTVTEMPVPAGIFIPGHMVVVRRWGEKLLWITLLLA
jgi:hypothetical protein